MDLSKRLGQVYLHKYDILNFNAGFFTFSASRTLFHIVGPSLTQSVNQWSGISANFQL